MVEKFPFFEEVSSDDIVQVTIIGNGVVVDGFQ
jgi:hypothetical protein